MSYQAEEVILKQRWICNKCGEEIIKNTTLIAVDYSNKSNFNIQTMRDIFTLNPKLYTFHFSCFDGNLLNQLKTGSFLDQIKT